MSVTRRVQVVLYRLVGRMVQEYQSGLPFACYMSYVVDEGLPKPRNDLPTPVLARCTVPLGHDPSHSSPRSDFLLECWKRSHVFTAIPFCDSFVITDSFASLHNS
jgi:hypothetical protein